MADDADPRWCIVQEGWDARTSRAYEGLLTIGSAGLHLRGSLEEHLRDAPQNVEWTRRAGNVTAERFPDLKARWGTFVPGVYGPHPHLGRELVNLPWFLSLVPEIDGERLDAERCDLPRCRRWLDLRRAILERRIVWLTAGGAVVELAMERIVSAARPHLCLQRCRIVADRAATLVLRAGIDADVRTNGHDHLVARRLERTGPAAIRCAVETDGGDRVVIVSELRGVTETWHERAHDRSIELHATVALAPGRPLVVEKRTAVATSRDRDPVAAEERLHAVDALEPDELVREHEAVWAARWSRSDVLVEGDDDSQRALRASIHHLLRAHPDDPGLAVDAKAYSGEAYWGRFFWDTELFLLPFYLYTDPDRAVSLARFRVGALPAARRNAARRGDCGARYPWESDPDGDEWCPGWLYADHEVHVSADVAYALAHVAAATGRDDLLRGPGAETIVEIARFWLGRIDRLPDGRATLLGVMGPDEYTPLAGDNAFTNRMAAFALDLAARVGAAGGASESERRDFAATAAGLPVLRHPQDPRLVLQCAGFHRLADPDFARWWTDRRRPFAAQVPQERLFRTRCLKQADVLMLMMLFPDEFSDEEVRRAWDEYVPLTTHDSSLSPGVHAIVAARLGLDDAAWAFWQRACAIDLDPLAGGAAEGIHAANAALVWQAAVLGFLGMRTAAQADAPTFRPRLPEAWRRLEAPLVWRGVPLRIAAEPASAEVRLDAGHGPLAVTVWGEPRTLTAGARASWTAPTI
ncbi:MAG: glycosyl hydrolase family 65 protein [Planctomycetota bacterium]|jgi:kojibiose phosphorylase